MDSSQLAKKVNQSPLRLINPLSLTFRIVALVHPWRGWGEYDRKGYLYYNEETKKFGYEDSGESFLLDGDYTPWSHGKASYGAPWTKSGVSEADCLICHLKGYQWKEKGGNTKGGGSFKYGPTVGAGWANINSLRMNLEIRRLEECQRL